MILRVIASISVLLVFSLGLLQVRRQADELDTGSSLGPSHIVPNDLWGIRDMILLGHGAMFMKTNSPGAREVQLRVQEFVKLLPTVHPYGPCREKFGALGCDISKDECILLAADLAWSCLPNISYHSFKKPFRPEHLKGLHEAKKAKMPVVVDRNLLGACAESNWDRTCSYWVSLHTMALLADNHEIGAKFLKASLTILAGGALLCEGCTAHLLVAVIPILDDAVVKDRGQAICTGEQCAYAAEHVDVIWPCVERGLKESGVVTADGEVWLHSGGPKESSKCGELKTEIDDLLAYRRLLKKFVEQPKVASASAGVLGLHNIVALSIRNEHIPNGRPRQLYCLDDLIKLIPDKFRVEKFDVMSMKLDEWDGVPGLGKASGRGGQQCEPGET